MLNPNMSSQPGFQYAAPPSMVSVALDLSEKRPASILGSNTCGRANLASPANAFCSRGGATRGRCPFPSRHWSDPGATGGCGAAARLQSEVDRVNRDCHLRLTGSTETPI
eukprot:443332-Pyramimonas_sp.AAC.1